MKLLICRTIIIYLCVLFAMRLMGKRQLGELQPEELVSTILISNLASISIESEEVPITSSLIPLFLIAALELLGSVLSFRSQKFFNFLSGRPKTVILDGKIDQNALRMLRRSRITPILAVRDPNITPALLKRKFNKRVKVEFPDLTDAGLAQAFPGRNQSVTQVLHGADSRLSGLTER